MVVGQRVVCVDDKFPDGIGQIYDELPVEGEVYRIRDVVLGINYKGEPGEVCLYLEELNNPLSKTPPHPERGFNAERFRPLEEDEEEMEEEAVKEEELELLV